jgi:DNA-binding transcriptional ArsR family regulator
MEKLEHAKILFQNLSDINRLKIVYFIGESEKSVGEVVEKLKLSQPLVSHHLRKLRECGILTTSRKGPFVNYHLSNPDILKLITEFSNLITKSQSYEISK